MRHRKFIKMHSTSPDPYKLSADSFKRTDLINQLEAILNREFTDIYADLVALGYTVVIVPISGPSLESRPDSYLASLGGIQGPFPSPTSTEADR